MEPKSDNRGHAVRIQATGPTLSVLVRMVGIAEKAELHRALVPALAPFVADVVAGDNQLADLLASDARDEWSETQDQRRPGGAGNC